MKIVEKGAWYICLIPLDQKQLLLRKTPHTMVRDMSSDASIKERKINFSLAATGATNIFIGNVPKKLFKVARVITLYERPTVVQFHSYQHLQVLISLVKG